MTASTDSPSRSRRSILAVITLGVLLAGTGVAWIISAGRTGERPGETWYIVTDAKDDPIGWEVVQRQDQGPRGGSGYSISGAYEGTALTWSKWRLDPDATAGHYVAAESERGLIHGRPTTLSRVTTIDYDGDAVVVKQSIWLGNQVAPKPRQTLAVDSSYIAEGCLRPTVVGVANTGEPLLATMVLDEPMNLVDLAIGPRGRQTLTLDGQQVALTAVAMTRLTQAEPSGRHRVYHVAQDGSIPLIEDVAGDTTVKRSLVGLRRVHRHFPSAASQRSRTLRQVQKFDE